ncbi:MAG: C-GCAxxG-C-C family protein [Methanomassiliicoccaceae archaeon]|nr:C-GCAxxG-C-C family protein [Methanomassiliicoccaceae archaeon]
MLTKDDVLQKFDEGIDCSMQILASVADIIGISKEEAYRTASLFGAGMHTGGVCGAVTGAFIALGIRYGNHVLNDVEQKGIALSKRTEFIKRFEKEHGSVNCPVLLGADIRDPEQLMRAHREGLIDKECPKFCITAERILKDML